MVDAMDAKGTLPKFPGDQPNGEQIGCQCWDNPEQSTLSQFYVAIVLNVMVEWDSKGYDGETNVTPSGSCGWWSPMSTQ